MDKVLHRGPITKLVSINRELFVYSSVPTQPTKGCGKYHIKKERSARHGANTQSKSAEQCALFPTFYIFEGDTGSNT